ncbi:integrase repeat-containing protein, partial [Rheinheimera sp. 4Y26]|uniref:integrase repeat-containing protein n=1 Tax=Rheinheimera sp. 4Y26 TaxID=2977811 RepID=UPI0021B151E6
MRQNVRFYPTLAEASQATIVLGITTSPEYKRRYKEDPRLPAHPDVVYKAEWQGWLHFLDKSKEPFYRTLTEASQATIALGITTRAEYNQRYKEDPRLPAVPNAVYKAEWQGWPHFLGKPKVQF